MEEYSQIQKAYIWLNSFSELSDKKQSQLIGVYKSAVKIINRFRTDRLQIVGIIGQELYAKMKSCLNREYMSEHLKCLTENKIKVITKEDKNYPVSLLQIDGLPNLLYTLGDITLLNTPMLTVVGSRKCTSYGEEQTAAIVKGLCNYGYTIVSGLAEGIDTVANTTALKNGKTIAVVAGGLNKIYPKSNEKLFYKIAEKGLIISQYPPNRVPLPYMFPLRNRIMAALGTGTVVIEAGEKSGALITANLALQYGKELFILPGNANSVFSKGSNNLLKEMQGGIITNYNDILDRLGIEKKTVFVRETKKDISKNEESVYNILCIQDEHIENIIQKTKLDIREINSILVLLEIKGLIVKKHNNIFGKLE